MFSKKSRLKARLKRTFEMIIYEFQDYDCGHKMLCTVSSRYYNLCVKYNRIADELSKIDPDCPKDRYEV